MEREKFAKIIGAAICVLVYVPILLALLLPNLYVNLGSACNESCTVNNLRTINTAEVTYLSSSGGNFGDLPALVAAGLLDDTFIGTATHPKAGYIYNITTTGSDYTATADPASTNAGRFGYYSHPDAVVRYSTNPSLAPTGQSGCSVKWSTYLTREKFKLLRC